MLYPLAGWLCVISPAIPITAMPQLFFVNSKYLNISQCNLKESIFWKSSRRLVMPRGLVMSLTDVQRKIQRCLAFVDAGSEHEARVAVEQAVRLCRHHGLVLTAVPAMASAATRPMTGWVHQAQRTVGTHVDMCC